MGCLKQQGSCFEKVHEANLPYPTRTEKALGHLLLLLEKVTSKPFIRVLVELKLKSTMVLGFRNHELIYKQKSSQF